MYYQNFKYPVRYASYFSNDKGRVYLDVMRGMIKTVSKGGTKYYDKDKAPKLILGIDLDLILQKFK